MIERIDTQNSCGGCHREVPAEKLAAQIVGIGKRYGDDDIPRVRGIREGLDVFESLFIAEVETFFDQLQDIQKTYVEAKKEAWNKIFPKIMAMQDKFAETLPEKLPTPPGMPESPVSPKEIAGKVKEFQETANKHAVEQADAVIDFAKQQQEQVKTVVTEAVDNIEKNIEEKAE